MQNTDQILIEELQTDFKVGSNNLTLDLSLLP